MDTGLYLLAGANLLLLLAVLLVLLLKKSKSADAGASIERLEGEVITLCLKIPGTLFKGAFKVLFYLVLPYGIMATIPTQFFSGTLSPAGFAYAVAIVAAFTAFTLFFWKLGLKNYKSASS